MNTGNRWTAVLGIVAIGAVGFLAHRAWVSAEQVAELSEAVQEREGRIAALQSELAEVEATVEQGKEEQSRLREQVEQATRAATAAVNQVRELQETMEARSSAAEGVEAAGGLGTATVGDMMSSLREMMDNPAMKGQMRLGLKMSLGMFYGDLFPELELQEEAREALEELLVDKMFAMMDVEFLRMDASAAEDEILKRQNDLYRELDRRLAETLTAEEIQRLEAHERGIPDKMARQQAEMRLVGMELEPWQREQVLSVLLEEARNMEEFNPMDPTGFNNGSLFGRQRLTREKIREARAGVEDGLAGLSQTDVIARIRERNERVLTRLQPILTLDQQEAFREQQESEIQMMKMAMNMYGGMSPGQQNE